MKKITFLTLNKDRSITESQKQNDCKTYGIATAGYWLAFINNGCNITTEGTQGGSIHE